MSCIPIATVLLELLVQVPERSSDPLNHSTQMRSLSESSITRLTNLVAKVAMQLLMEMLI